MWTKAPELPLVEGQLVGLLNVRSRPGGYAGAGNLNVAPLLLNTSSGNQHLDPASPAINAGSSTILTLLPIDMDGDPRVR